MRVPDQLTPMTPEQAAAALAEAYRAVLGRPIDAPTLAILVAKTALETGHWKSIHCWNWGNVKGADPKSGRYCMFYCDERLLPHLALAAERDAVDREDGNGKNVRVQRPLKVGSDGRMRVEFWPPHQQCKFRAYESAVDGASQYIEFLSVDTTPDNGKPNRYERAWQAAEDDDPVRFVDELSKAGYFTAQVDKYRSAVVSLFRKYLPICQAQVASEATQPEEPAIDAGKLLDMIALTLDKQKTDFFEGDTEDQIA